MPLIATIHLVRFSFIPSNASAVCRNDARYVIRAVVRSSKGNKKKSLLHKKGPLISAPIALCFYYDSLIIAHQRERQTPIMSGSPNSATIAKDLKT